MTANTPEPVDGLVERERANLCGLLHREGQHSGVWFAEHLTKAADLIVGIEAELTAARQRIADLEGALEPFARAHGTVARLDASDHRWPDHATLDCDDAIGFAEFVKVGDLRCARALLITPDLSHRRGE
jgi:hypothetical protein